MQRLEVSGAVRPLYGSLGVKGLNNEMSGAFSKHCGGLKCEKVNQSLYRPEQALRIPRG